MYECFAYAKHSFSDTARPVTPPGSASAPVKSAMRTLDVLEFVVAHADGVVAQDIAGALAIPLSSLSYLLATLAERGYLQRDGRRYRPGPGLQRLRVGPAEPTLAERVAPLVRALKRELNETASFMVRAEWEVEAVVTEASDQVLRYAIEPGMRRPLHALAAGKVILSQLDEADLARYFAQSPREALTEFTHTSEADLRADIAAIRRDGLCTSGEEATLGIRGIAVPALRQGQPIGAFSVALPAVRWSDDLAARISEALRRAATALG